MFCLCRGLCFVGVAHTHKKLSFLTSSMRSLSKRTMKEFNENHKKFAKLLKALRLTKDSTITIALLLQENHQMVAMAEYLKENPNATESEILKKAVEINEA